MFTRIKRAAAALAVAGAALVVTAAPAAAHYSSYCGHGATGYNTNGDTYETIYMYQWANGTGYYHQHRYKHTLNGVEIHQEWKTCPYYH